MSCKYDRENHRYTIDGIIVPSVTEISKVFDVMKYGKLPYYQDGAADEGNRVHEFCRHCLSIPGYTDRSIMDKSGWSAVAEKVSDVFLKLSIIPGSPQLKIEEPRYSKLDFAGTPDLVIETLKENIVVDWKYGVPQLSHAYQLAGYGILANADIGYLVYLKDALVIKKVVLEGHRKDYFLNVLNMKKRVLGEKI